MLFSTELKGFCGLARIENAPALPRPERISSRPSNRCWEMSVIRNISKGEAFTFIVIVSVQFNINSWKSEKTFKMGSFVCVQDEQTWRTNKIICHVRLNLRFETENQPIPGCKTKQFTG